MTLRLINSGTSEQQPNQPDQMATQRRSADCDTMCQTMQSIQSWRQTGPKQATKVHKTKASNARRCGDSCLRLRRTLRMNYEILSIILCAAMVPSVFCSCSPSAGAGPSKNNAAAAFFPSKKSISFSKGMNHANFQGNCQADLQNDEDEPSLYTPLRSCSQFERAGTRLRGTAEDGSSPLARQRLLLAGDMTAASPYVYTRLQTRLFPEMRF